MGNKGRSMKSPQLDWRWLLVNLSALVIMILLIQGDPDLSSAKSNRPDPMLESGK
jgi:hypothetical protein